MTSTPNGPITTDQLQRIITADSFRLTPATLAVRMTKGKYLTPRHILKLSQIVAHELAKGNARIIVSMPPRHGKSKFGSVRTPVWQYDRFPDRQIGITSYGADLATEFSEEVRDIILEDQNDEHGEKLLRVKLATTKVNNWTTTEKGRMYAVGVGGSLYGRGVHDLFVDDYYKNVEEAESESYRTKVFEWFGVIASTRLEPGGNIIIIATRWHPDDLSGRLLAMPNSPWREIRIPGIAEPGDLLGREPGEALWPERYTTQDLLNWKATMGGYFFDAIVQQKPRRSRSNVFQEHWVQIIDSLPKDISNWIAIRSWDLAGTEGGGDYTAAPLCYANKATGEFIIADCIREQFSPGAVELLVTGTASLDSSSVHILIEQEPGSAGKTVIAHYRTLLKGYKLKAVRETGSKFIRAQPFMGACEAGRVKVLRGDWNSAWFDEMSSFPDGDNDDQVDGTSAAFNHAFSNRRTAGTFGRMIGNKAYTGVNNNTRWATNKAGVIVPNDGNHIEKPKTKKVFSTTWGRRNG